MKKALLYKQIKENTVRCTACKQYCTITPGSTGICGVRQNRAGDLHLLVYGKASAVNIDPIEKKPLYHFLPNTRIFSIGTVGCNFACSFCQNWDLAQVTKRLKEELLRKKQTELIDIEVGKYGYDLPPEALIKTCLEQNIPSIAFTYNEPTIFFEYLYDTARMAHKKGIKCVMVSNGYTSQEALALLHEYIDAYNIDLKSFSEEFYQNICRAKLAPVLETIKEVYNYGIWLEITTLVIPGKNDSDEELVSIASFIADLDPNIPWHISAFFPQYKMQDVPPTSRQALIRAYDIGKSAGLKYIYVGNIIDDERSHTYCPVCGKIMIRRNGFFSETENMNKQGICQNCEEAIPGVWK